MHTLATYRNERSTATISQARSANRQHGVSTDDLHIINIKRYLIEKATAAKVLDSPQNKEVLLVLLLLDELFEKVSTSTPYTQEKL